MRSDDDARKAGMICTAVIMSAIVFGLLFYCMGCL